MEGKKAVAIVDDELTDDNLHSAISTPLISRISSQKCSFDLRTNQLQDALSSTQRKIEGSSSSSRMLDSMGSESDDVRQGDGGEIKWHNNQLLQKQLMEATLEDKRLSELCLQRAVQGPQTRMPERKRCGSWGSLKYLLFGIVPASLFIFALACALSHMQLEYPQ